MVAPLKKFLLLHAKICANVPFPRTVCTVFKVCKRAQDVPKMFFLYIHIAVYSLKANFKPILNYLIRVS
jgi:hypothetical protein